MKDLKVVTLFTMKEMLKRKSFIVTTIIILVLIILGFNIPNIINFFTKNNTQTESETELLIVDANNVFEGTLENLNSMNLGYNIKVSNENLTFDDIKSKIENEEIEEAIIIEPKDTKTYNLRYIVKNMATISNLPEDLLNAINTVYTNLQISKLGLTQEQLSSLTASFEYSIEQTEEQEVSGNVMVIKLNYNRKNIKDNGNISNFNKSKNNSNRKNNWYRNCRTSTSLFICCNSFNISKTFLRTRNIRISARYV